MENKCEVRHCRKETGLVFYKHDVCEFHWEEFCKGKIDLMETFGIPLEVIAQ